MHVALKVLISISEPAVANPPDVHSLDKDSVNVTYNPSSKLGGFPERFYIVYKEKGKCYLHSILACSMLFYSTQHFFICSIPIYFCPLYSFLFHYILVCPILFHFVLFYSIPSNLGPFYSIAFYFDQFYSIPSHLAHSIPLYFTLLRSILLHSILFCSISLYDIMDYTIVTESKISRRSTLFGAFEVYVHKHIALLITIIQVLASQSSFLANRNA